MPVRAVVDTILDAVGSGSPVIEEETARPSFTIDIDKVRHELGFEPVATREIVERYVRSNLAS